MATGWINLPAFGAPSWKGTALTAGSLPALGNVTGDIRATLDTFSIYIWNGTTWLLEVTPGAAVVSINPFGSSPNAAGGTISGNVLTLQPADATHPGGLSISAQTIAGNKTFSGVTSLTSFRDTTSTGAMVTLAAPTTTNVIVANAGLESINAIDPAGVVDGQLLVLTNGFSEVVDLLDGSSGGGIRTGTSSPYSMLGHTSHLLIYDANSGFWNLVSGSTFSARELNGGHGASFSFDGTDWVLYDNLDAKGTVYGEDGLRGPEIRNTSDDLVIDLFARTLKSSLGATVVDFENGNYYDSNGIYAMSSFARELGDEIGNPAVSWSSSTFYVIPQIIAINGIDLNAADLTGGRAGNFTSIKNAAEQGVVGGSTSGQAAFSQPEQGASYKKVIIRLDALLGTAAYVFPTEFTYIPAILTTNQLSSSLVTSLTTSGVTVTGATSTGFLILEGF